MSGEGPTTVGSIDAKLTIDASQFDRKAEEAKATAHELGALSPDIKVDANVGPALAKFAEVAAAEQVMADGADNDTQATNRNISANNQRVRGLQILIGLAPAILASAAPIGAAAVGLGAAFGVMAVSGVLAVKGIKDAMEVGDTVGQQYSAGMVSLKGVLDELSATAANRMLSGFSTAVGDINDKLPFLNQLVGNFSGMLGNMGGSVLDGVLNGLQAMNPLLQEGGIQLGKFVGWLSGMTSSNGFTSFVTYAIDNLPPVMHLIEGLVSLAGNILAAFAPLGPVMVGILSAITDGLNSLPLPVLAGLITSAALIGPAFTIARTAVALFGTASETAAGGVTLFGIAANLAIPVVGVITAAVAGVGIAMAASSLSTTTATQVTQDYTQALKDDNDAIGEHVRLQAAKALSDAGAFQAAQTLGISQKTLTDAATGNADAMAQVKAKTDAANDAYNQSIASTHGMSFSMAESSDTAKAQRDAIDKVTGAVGTNTAAIDRGKQANQDIAVATDSHTQALALQAAQYGTTITAYQSATAAQAATAQQTADTTLKMQMQNDAAGLLKQAWDSLNGKTISAAQAQNAFDSSLVNMGDHVDKTGKKITFTTTSIGDMSSASVALRGQLNGQVTALEGVIEANGGLDNATAQSKQQYAEMRQKIIDNAVAHGVNRDAVTAYVDSLFKIPTAVKTQVELDAAQAEANLATFQAHLDGLRDRTVYVTEQTIKDPGGTGSSVGGRANGSLAGGFATGGMVPHYLAEGGHPGGPKGTDTIPAWLTPGEIVMKTAAVKSLGAGNLLAANRTGQWPAQAQQGSSQPVVVNLVLDGQIIDSRTVHLINGVISSATNDARYRRVGV